MYWMYMVLKRKVVILMKRTKKVMALLLACGMVLLFGNISVSLAEDPNPVNLAEGCTVTASSEYDQSANVAESAVDGDLGTLWTSETGTSTDTYWLTVDLGQSETIARYVLKNYDGLLPTYNLSTRDFKIQYSNDNTNWTDEDIVTGNTATVVENDVDFTARYVRVYITNPTNDTTFGYNARIVEFELYAPDNYDLTSAITAEIGPDHSNWVHVLNESDYYANTWTDYTTAIQDAITVENDSSATQSEIDAAIANLQSAKGALELKYGNFAAGKTVTASSEYDQSENIAESAVDGDLTTQWTSTTGTSTDTYWLTVDLGQSLTIAKYVLRNYGGMLPTYNLSTKDFKIQYSNDNTNWTDADVVTGNTETVVEDDVDFTARYVRVYITNPTNDTTFGYNARIVEIELYPPQTINSQKEALSNAITAEVGSDHANPVYVLEEQRYSTQTWSAFETAIDDAITVEGYTNPTLAQLNTAIDDISTAKAALVVEKYKLTLETTSGGTVTTGQDGFYAPNAQISLTATASTDYAFRNWVARYVNFNDGEKYSNSSFTFTMPSKDTTLTAYFLYDKDVAMTPVADNWFLGAKYCLYTTWAYNTPPWPMSPTLNPDGTKPANVDELADGFDIDAFVQAAVDMNVDYVTFTSWHAGGYALYPSEFMAKTYPGHHTTTRDVIAELGKALNAVDIKLQVYIHALVAQYPTIPAADATMLGYHDSTDNYEKYNDFVNGFYDEMTYRYANMTDPNYPNDPIIDGYWIDAATYDAYQDKIDSLRLRKTILKNDPGIPLSCNGNDEITMDYGTREDGTVRMYDVNQRLSYAEQTVVLLSHYWGVSVPNTAPNAAFYDADHLFRYMALTAGVNDGGGGLGVGASPYATEGFEPGIKETMIRLGNLVEPVEESLKQTYPSTSIVTLSGNSILTLPGGVTATQSIDGTKEYIHVLKAPGQVFHTEDGKFEQAQGTEYFTYTGTWEGNSPHHFSNTINDTASITFSGTKIKLNAYKDSMHGIMAVSIDGGPETMVDLYSATRTLTETVYTSPTLINGTHTLTVRFTGNKNASSSDTYTSVESVIYTNSTTNQIHLPVPADGKTFSSATMLRTNNSVTLVQDSSGVHITVPDEWDLMDTVIKLDVQTAPDWTTTSTAIPQNQLSVYDYTNEVTGHEAADVIDGNNNTYWLTHSDLFSSDINVYYAGIPWGSRARQTAGGDYAYEGDSITVDLGATYDLNQISYLPRQDGTTWNNVDKDVLYTFIAEYNISVSTDGTNFVPVKVGRWKYTEDKKTIDFPAIEARYVKIASHPAWNYMSGWSPISAAEFSFGEAP